MKKTIMALMATTFLMTAGAASAAINPVNIGESSSAENIYSVILDKVEAGETAGIQSGFAWAYVNGGFVSLSVTELQRHGANAGKFFSEYVGEQVLIDFIAKNEEKAAAMKEALFVLVDDGSRAALTFVQSQIASVEANIDAAQARLDGIESAIEAADMAAADARMEMLTAAESYMTELQTAYNEGEAAGRMSVTPEDGIHQADVDAAYDAAFDAAAALVTADDGVSEADHIRAIGEANDAARAAGRLAGIADALDDALDAFDLSTLAANNPLLSVVGDRTAGFSLELDPAAFVNVDTTGYKISIEAVNPTFVADRYVNVVPDRTTTERTVDYSGLNNGFYRVAITGHAGRIRSAEIQVHNGAITATYDVGVASAQRTVPLLSGGVAWSDVATGDAVPFAEAIVDGTLTDINGDPVSVNVGSIQIVEAGTFIPGDPGDLIPGVPGTVTGYTLSFDGVDASVAPTGDNALTFVPGSSWTESRPLANGDYYVQASVTYVYHDGQFVGVGYMGARPTHNLGFAPTGTNTAADTMSINRANFEAALTANGVPATEDRFVAADGFVVPAGAAASAGVVRAIPDAVVGSSTYAYEIMTDHGLQVHVNSFRNLNGRVIFGGAHVVADRAAAEAMGALWIGSRGNRASETLVRYNEIARAAGGTLTLSGLEDSAYTDGSYTFSVALSDADVDAINGAITDAYKAGYAAGYADGYEDGYTVGFSAGVASVTN